MGPVLDYEDISITALLTENIEIDSYCILIECPIAI